MSGGTWLREGACREVVQLCPISGYCQCKRLKRSARAGRAWPRGAGAGKAEGP
jgi:hypothetical protein